MNVKTIATQNEHKTVDVWTDNGDICLSIDINSEVMLAVFDKQQATDLRDALMQAVAET